MPTLKEWLATPLTELSIKGLGPKTKEKLINANIETVSDLLAFTPREYLDFSEITPIPSAPLETPVHIRGKVISRKVSRTPRKRVQVLEILVDDGQGTMRVAWFNQPHIHDKIIKEQRLSLFGKIRFEKLGRTMNSPKFEVLSRLGESEPVQTGITPIYREVGGLRSANINKWILQLLETMPDEETLPKAWLAKEGFPSRAEALRTLHAPADGARAKAIRTRQDPSLERLIFEEFYHFQRGLQRLAVLGQQGHYHRFHPEPESLAPFLGRLPFRPTPDQIKVMRTLVDQLALGRRLHTLIQGDVGCGKTVVGLAAAFLFARAGLQSALLCPTAVLAGQHCKSAKALLEPLGMRVGLLSSQCSTAETREILTALARGELDLVVGTHRLFQKDVIYANLGLVMVDEQHRFGVNQRRTLLKKGSAPHYLAFTATPIPRSLAMSLYGDFDVLQIRQKPADRIPPQTILKRAENREEILTFAKRRLAEGESVFWVFPLIEGEEEANERSAVTMFETFRSGPFAGIPMGLIHGKMDKEAQQKEMDAFTSGRYRILIATSVIEVGVDVPQATIMVVESANYFGLSQLHQLRGRVGRGGGHAFCFLVVPSDIGRDALRRMRMLESCDDGFDIAAFDLKERGAGHLFGTRQTGAMNFRFGDPWLDAALMDRARDAARASWTEEAVAARETQPG
ncbi:ATP-dependent DNA helicase RecG [Sulfidibacter corallicola]|uniref:ATP-dependent DNA helicase RecG n=1 Tax=Sulfidibacter corallicola TaxID=2818388 RepID=A0A8A4TDB7_SULCO|nr:ATP-dependent DNA helicase RecG [Sulfidibacter corallicola]QTD47653.1 ATP-dependent DNA helicase RecG [Sulfidibacter corallicola]